MTSHNTSGISERPVKARKNEKKLLGRGATGAVYLGLDEETGRLVAIKEIPLPQQPTPMDVIGKELHMVQQAATHPNVVQYYNAEICQEEALFRIYMEYVPGVSLASLIRNMGPLPLSVTRRYAADILRGLQYLHNTLRLCHRDIKPDNILVTSDGVCKVTDFGVCSLLKEGTAGCATVVGTPMYMPPEMLQGDRYGCAADIWSFACVIYEMTTGKPPWHECPNPASVMFRVVQGTEVPTLPPNSDPLLVSFLELCFRRDPTARPTAVQLLEHPFLEESKDGTVKNVTVQRAATNTLKEGTASASTKGNNTSTVANVQPQKTSPEPSRVPQGTLTVERQQPIVVERAQPLPSAQASTSKGKSNMCDVCTTERALFCCDSCKPAGNRQKAQFCIQCWGSVHTDATLSKHAKAPLLFANKKPPVSTNRVTTSSAAPEAQTMGAIEPSSSYQGVVLENGRLVDVLRPEMSWACPRCTFLNHPCLSKCEMCET